MRRGKELDAHSAQVLLDLATNNNETLTEIKLSHEFLVNAIGRVHAIVVSWAIPCVDEQN